MNKTVLGLDIGGTKITGIVYDGKSIVRELTVGTPKNLKSFKFALEKLLDFLSSGKHIRGVGAGVAGLMSPKSGQIVFSPNLKCLLGFNLERFLKSKKYKHIAVENDANCFALAERTLGKGKAYRDFVGITLGTGIGGGIISGGRLFSGSRGSAGEAGHMMADFKYDSEHYFQKARDKKDFKKMGEVLGILFANVINLLDVEALVLGGTVTSRHSAQFLPYALQTAKKHVVNKSNFPKLVISQLKNAGSLGAALLALQEL